MTKRKVHLSKEIIQNRMMQALVAGAKDEDPTTVENLIRTLMCDYLTIAAEHSEVVNRRRTKGRYIDPLLDMATSEAAILTAWYKIRGKSYRACCTIIVDCASSILDIKPRQKISLSDAEVVKITGYNDDFCKGGHIPGFCECGQVKHAGSNLCADCLDARADAESRQHD
jgi:hypothetical protein